MAKQVYRKSVFVICHKKELKYYNNFKKHIGPSESISKIDSNLTVPIGQEIEQNIYYHIRKATYLVFFASSDAQHDPFLRTLFTNQISNKVCFVVHIKHIKLAPSFDGATVYPLNGLGLPLNSSFEDEDAFWTKFIEHLDFVSFKNYGFYAINKGDYKEGINYLTFAKKYNQEIDFLDENIKYAEQKQFELIKTNEIKKQLDVFYKDKFKNEIQLTQQIQDYEGDRNFFTKVFLGIAAALLLSIVLNFNQCSNSVKKTYVSLDKDHIYTPIKVYDFYPVNFRPNRNPHAIRNNLAQRKIGVLNTEVVFKSIDRSVGEIRLFWTLTFEDVSKVHLTSKGDSFLGAKDVTLTGDFQTVRLEDDNFSSSYEFYPGQYKLELWVEVNNEIILIHEDYFEIL